MRVRPLDPVRSPAMYFRHGLAAFVGFLLWLACRQLQVEGFGTESSSCASMCSSGLLSMIPVS